MKNGQAAMEFLLTYGWAICVVVVGISALTYFGVLSPSNLAPKQCHFPVGISCMDFEVKQSSNQVVFALKNNLGDAMEGTTVSISGCNSWTNNSEIPNGGTFTATLNCGQIQGGNLQEAPTISYKKKSSGLTFTESGSISGKIGSGSGTAVFGQSCTTAADCNDIICTQKNCNNGTCSYNSTAVGGPCSSGVCDAKGNCVGCIGNDTSSCTAQQCNQAICSNENCSYTPIPYDTACKGFCSNGNCQQCTLTNTSFCTTPVCQTASCSANNTCIYTPISSDPRCVGGTCNNGQCIIQCTATNLSLCNAPICQQASCNSGMCQYTPKSSDPNCAGVCDSSTCQTSWQCAINSQCNASFTRCDNSTHTCVQCLGSDSSSCSASTCQTAVCSNDICAYQNATNGYVSNGYCLNGVLVSCMPGDTNNLQQHCPSANPCASPYCSATGTCSYSAIPDGTYQFSPSCSYCLSGKCDSASNPLISNTTAFDFDTQSFMPLPPTSIYTEIYIKKTPLGIKLNGTGIWNVGTSIATANCPPNLFIPPNPVLSTISASLCVSNIFCIQTSSSHIYAFQFSSCPTISNNYTAQFNWLQLQ